MKNNTGQRQTISVKGRIAGSGDDGKIREFLRSIPLQGNVRLRTTCEPSFFDAVQIHGEDASVFLGEYGDRIVAMGMSATRELFINGFPMRVGYLGSLRLDPEFRNSTALFRGFRMLKEIHEEKNPGIFYLTSILEENKIAREILTSGRAGLPTYRELFKYTTLLIPGSAKRTVPAEYGLELLRGDSVGTDEIFKFICETGRSRQFFPVYSRSRIDEKSGLLSSISPQDFLVAFKGGRIEGVAAIWDQMPFRQYVVDGYSLPYRPMVLGSNILGILSGFPPLPKAGNPFRHACLSCVAIRDDSAQVFSFLLNHALEGLSACKTSFLAVGMAEQDPLLKIAGKFRHKKLRSRIYAVDWGDANDKIISLDPRPAYLELGSL